MSSDKENLTRVYTINLGRAWLTPQYRRTDRVINIIKEFARKHMKSHDVKLDQDLNRQIWNRGKAHPPRKVRVKMVKDEDGAIIVSLYEQAIKVEESSHTMIRSTTDDEEQIRKEEEEI
jgi:large subunit ribosomal protein L31e